MTPAEIREALDTLPPHRAEVHDLACCDADEKVREAARLYALLLENGQEVEAWDDSYGGAYLPLVEKPGRYLVVPVSTTTPREDET